MVMGPNGDIHRHTDITSQRAIQSADPTKAGATCSGRWRLDGAECNESAYLWGSANIVLCDTMQ